MVKMTCARSTKKQNLFGNQDFSQNFLKFLPIYRRIYTSPQPEKIKINGLTT